VLSIDASHTFLNFHVMCDFCCVVFLSRRFITNLEQLQLENMKMRTGKILYTHLCQSGIHTIKNINQLASSSLCIHNSSHLWLDF